MKYSDGKIKKEHHILPEFKKLLKQLSENDCIQRIIPGRISRQQKGSSVQRFSISYPTESGVKCIMKKGGTAQELFLTGKSDEILLVLEAFLT